MIKKVILKANCSREKKEVLHLRFIYLYLIGLFFIDPILCVFFFFLKNSILEEELNFQRFVCFRWWDRTRWWE